MGDKFLPYLVGVFMGSASTLWIVTTFEGLPGNYYALALVLVLAGALLVLIDMQEG